ncbi:hypothetical protein ES703_38123 [subsurface metagenome]
MKIEVEIEDSVYSKIKELMPSVDLDQAMGQMWGAILLVFATYPEEFMAVFTGQASPDQRQRVDEAMKHQAAKVFDKVSLNKQ